ncbi:hypothetical protein V2J09_011517 [Rumex salicifolius]
MSTINVEENEQQRRKKLEEEVLEVKSLRRIISAYLNYADAAEEDVRRYERSFRNLPPAHKALLCHLPLKYHHLKGCISVNTYFILNMLQAFEPPLDISLDIDPCVASIPENLHDGCHIHERISPSDSLGMTDASRSSADEEEQLGGSECGDRLHEHAQGDGSTKCPVLPNAYIPSNGSGYVRSGEHKVTSSSYNWLDPSLQLKVPLVDVDKVRCIVRNIVRDWAAEGQEERDQCYNPILEELKRLFTGRSAESPPCCLVPGAGLGRLALEISRIGFACQGNEFSYYMMICSSFILNYSQSVGEWTIHPWIHSNCNSLSDADQLRPVTIPDILPASAGITEGFSMCGGDFVEVYSDPDQGGAWDVVVTCFFIDTAHNVVEYIEVIWNILKDGGVWINLGPLLYHFADMYCQDNEMSIELSLEDVKKVALQIGFELEKETTIKTTYTTNPRSMMQNWYNAAFWTMRKPKRVEEPSDK